MFDFFIYYKIYELLCELVKNYDLAKAIVSELKTSKYNQESYTPLVQYICFLLKLFF